MPAKIKGKSLIHDVPKKIRNAKPPKPVPRAREPRTLYDILISAAHALEELTIRYPLEGYAQNGKCKCLQFEDYNRCRHTRAAEVVEELRHQHVLERYSISIEEL